MSFHLLRTIVRPVASTLALIGLLAGPPARAEDAWNPFDRPAQPKPKLQPPPPPADPRPALPPMGGDYPPPGQPWGPQTQPHAPPGGPPAAAPPYGAPADGWKQPASGVAPGLQPPAPLSKDGVVRSDLPPPNAGDGSGLAGDAWAGLDLAAVEQLIGPLARPDRSSATMEMWRRLWPGAGPSALGRGSEGGFEALRLEALYRTGLVDDMQAAIKGLGARSDASPLVEFLLARAALTGGSADRGCELARSYSRALATLPERTKAQALVLGAYCAARSRDPAAASLAAGLLRDAGVAAEVPLAVLDALAAKSAPGTTLPRTLTVLDFRFLELVRRVPDLAAVIERAEPALLVVLAKSAEAPAARAAAAEAAARINALDAAGLSAAYMAAVTATDGRSTDTPLRRAALVAGLELEPGEPRRIRLARDLVTEGAKAGLALHAARIAGTSLHGLRPDPRLGADADPIIAALIAAGRFPEARAWIGAISGGRSPWAALADIADPAYPGPRGGALTALDEAARSGQLPAEFLHRLVTVLDALDYQIPIPLWEAASRTPQPAAGHLPPTGVLSELKAASERREVARTILLSMTALGHSGIDGAHMLAIGDAIRALRRAGLEREARAIGLEALFAGWPRQRAP